MRPFHTPFVSSEVETPDTTRGVSTSLDTNGCGNWLMDKVA